jgi:hypothetical protein
VPFQCRLELGHLLVDRKPPGLQALQARVRVLQAEVRRRGDGQCRPAFGPVAMRGLPYWRLAAMTRA